MLWVHELETLTEGSTALINQAKRPKKKKEESTISLKAAGFFIFGGQDETGAAQNDLYLFTFNLDRNRDRISVKDAEYKPSAVAVTDLEGDKVKTKGKPPSPRFKHSAELFKDYFIVHGGRNDLQYNESLKTVALNDLHLLDLKTMTWNTVAIYGLEMPESRWG